MSKKLIFVDVGTHEGQEYNAIFGHGTVTYFRRWLRHCRHERRAGRNWPAFSGFKDFLGMVGRLQANRHSVAYVMVEPNARLFALPVYRNADLGCNIALADEPDVLSVRPLYLAQSNPMGQGSSLFTEKPNVEASQFDLVLSVDALHFAKQLKAAVAKMYDADDAPVILRLNNEGAEVDVIEAFYSVFGGRLQLVMGSLNDVIKVKGQSAYDDLMQSLDRRGIRFLPFHQNYATWPAAAEAIAKVLDQR